MIYEHISFFHGKKVKEWQPNLKEIDNNFNYRISVSFEDAEEGKTWTEFFAQFLETPGVNELTGLIVGVWEESFDISSANIIQAIVAAKDRLTKLNAIFIGDMTSEDCEISWIIQSDVTPILKAYPNLEEFGVRGGLELVLFNFEHRNLQKLVIESGGLDIEVISGVLGSRLPKLEHLELWLGTEDYGAHFQMNDFTRLFNGELFQSLKYLGLRDSQVADDLAVKIANSEIIKRLEIIDLSLGTLSDKGAQAFLDSDNLQGLKEINLSYHYISEQKQNELKTLAEKTGISIILDDAQDLDEDYRYVAVSE